MLSPRFRAHLTRPAFHLPPDKEAVRERLRGKIESGEYPLEDVGCAVCGRSPFEVIAQRERYGLPYRVVICRDCGLVYVNPRMTVEATLQFYEREFRLLHGGHDEANLASAFAKTLARSRDIWSFVHDLVPVSGSVLEIGCGTGANLKSFLDAGCQVGGCDYGERYLEYGRSHGLTGLVQGGGEAFMPQYESGTDIVILSHVLEHFTDVGPELETVKRLLKPSGLLFVAVPGIRTIPQSNALGNLLAFWIISHNYHFSLTSLSNLLARYGFELVRGDERIFAVFRVRTTDRIHPVDSCYREDLNLLRRLEWRWRTWTLPQRFLWERRHLGIRRRLSTMARTPASLVRRIKAILGQQ